MKDVFSRYYSCAGININVRSDFPIGPGTFHPKFTKFEISTSLKSDVVLCHHFHPPDPLKLKGEKILFKNETWSVGLVDEKWIYRYQSEPPVRRPYSAVGIFNDSHQYGQIFVDGLNEQHYLNAMFLSLLMFNNDQLLLSRLLADKGGIILHGNAMLYKNKAIVLTGRSGSGKTTLSEMLEKHGMEILCDDRLVLKKNGNRINLYGSWLHGYKEIVSSKVVGVDSIVFLNHSDRNYYKVVVDKKEKLHLLIDSIIKPFYNSMYWIDMLSMIKKMVNSILVIQLYFNLNGEIVSIIKDDLMAGGD